MLCFLALGGHCLQMLCLPGFGTHANTQNLPDFRAFPASIHKHSPQSTYFSWQTLNCQIVPALPPTVLHLEDYSGESNRPMTPILFEKYRDTPPISIAILCKSMPSFWQRVVYTPPICITIRLPFVSRCFCRSIRVRGRWNTPKLHISLQKCLTDRELGGHRMPH